jgi:Rrf2 family iron-sulfur cluster assembly transcriptional regulator
MPALSSGFGLYFVWSLAFVKEPVMRLSTKSRFAVNALIDLALREQAGPVALAAISARQQISLSYLEQLFSRLRVAGLVESTRGPGGGYTLGRTADAISVADIVSAVEGPGTDSEAADTRSGLARDLWARLDDVMHQHMTGIRLAELVEEQRHRGVAVETRPVARRAIAPRPVSRPMGSGVPNSVFAFGRSFGRG